MPTRSEEGDGFEQEAERQRSSYLSGDAGLLLQGGCHLEVDETRGEKNEKSSLFRDIINPFRVLLVEEAWSSL